MNDLLTLMPQITKYIVLAILAGVAVWIVSYAINKKRPATDEASIGFWMLHDLNTGKKYKGYVSLAKKYLTPSTVTALKNAIDEKKIDVPPNMPKNWKLKVEKLIPYGMRKGSKKILILSTQEIQSPTFSQTEPGLKPSIHGVWSVLRHVYAYSMLVGGGKNWHSILMINPLNLKTLTIESEKYFKGMEATAELAGNLHANAELLRQEMWWDTEKKVIMKRFKEATDGTAKEVDLRMIAEIDEAKRRAEEKTMSKPFSVPEGIEYLVIAGLMFAVGYLYGSDFFWKQMRVIIEPFLSGLLCASVGAIITWIVKRLR